MSLTTSEHQQRYNEHRLRVLNAKSIVNSQAPQRICKQPVPANKTIHFLQIMSSLRSCKNNERTFTKSPDSVLHQVSSKRSIGNFSGRSQISLTSTCSRNQFNSLDKKDSRASVKLKKKNIYHIPEHVQLRYSYLPITPGTDFFTKLLRPKIYLDLEVKAYRPLGHIVIQLFTEACPNVVLGFVSACVANRTDSFNFTRLFTPLWLEGELAIESDQLLDVPNLEHDTNVLDHGDGSGILSFPSRYVRGSKLRTLNFSISFKPLAVLNGKRIAFGKIRSGYRILNTIQEFSTKNGKPLREIVVTKCGMLH